MTLFDAVHETLDANGVLNQLRARMRAEVFRVLEDEEQIRTTVSNENLLINELIREYFEFNHYQYALSVFLSESNQPQAPVNRDILLRELGFSRDPADKRIPLLYSIAFEKRNSNSSKTQPPQLPLSDQPQPLTTADLPDEFEHQESQKDEILVDVRRKLSISRQEVHVERGESNDHFHVEHFPEHAIDRYSENSSKNEEFSVQDDRPQQGTMNFEQTGYIEPQVMSSDSIDQIFSSEAVEEDESFEEEDPSSGAKDKDISAQLGSNLSHPETQSKTDGSASNGNARTLSKTDGSASNDTPKTLSKTDRSDCNGTSSISVHIEEDTQEPDGYSDDFEASSEEEKTSRLRSS